MRTLWPTPYLGVRSSFINDIFGHFRRQMKTVVGRLSYNRVPPIGPENHPGNSHVQESDFSGLGQSIVVARLQDYFSSDARRRTSYIRDASGAITTFNVPGSDFTSVGALNDLGQVGGDFQIGCQRPGYIRDA